MTDQVLRRDSRQGSPSRSQALSDLRRKHRSCVSCYRRKVRCNRTLPCTPCARAGLECTYPSSDRSASNRPPSLQDVSDRLERLETLLVEALSRDAVEDDRGSGKKALGSDGEVIPEPSIEPAHSRKSCSRPWEALLQAGNRAHYVDNTNLLDLFQDEGRINPPELGKIQDNAPISSSELNLTLGLSPITLDSGTGLGRLHPDTRLALKLWTVYTERVDPVLKVLHIPTMQSAMISVISEPGHMSPSLEALVFAVYFAAATSLSDDEMVAISPETTRQMLLQRCKLGLSHAAAKADLLNEPNVTSLQALAIFATCLRVHDNSRAVWVLIGTAIRLAQSIGIHRDGASLKLDPFESELRLRLWWQLCLLDSRAPEDHGFANTIENLGHGLRLPLNVDDAQLYPAMRTLPAESEAWTETTFCLVQLEAAKLLHQVLGLNARNGTEAACTLQGIEKQRAEIEQHNQRVEARFLTLPRASDLRSLASAHYYTACSKMNFMLQVRQELYVCSHDKHGVESPAAGAALRGLEERPFRAACGTLEKSCALADGQISTKYTWIFKTYTQWYALAYVLRYLCAFPSAPGTQEAWLLVNRTFSTVSYARQPPSDPLAPTGRNSIWRCLALLRYQALSARAAAQGSSVAGPSPPAASTDRGTLPSPGTTGLQDPFVTDSDSYSFGPSVHQMESSDLLSGLPAQLSDQWQSGFPSFGQLAMPEMLYLPEWNDIVNRG